MARPGWFFVLTDMIRAFPGVEPRDKDVLADLYIKGSSDDGASGSFAIKWHDLDRVPTPVLDVWCDGWEALEASGMVPLLAGHDTGKDRPTDFREPLPPPISIEQLKAELAALGFADDTEKFRSQGPDVCSSCGGKGLIYKRAAE